MRRILALDLEDTVVTPIVNGWHNFDIINLTKVRDVLRSFDPHSVIIFSFAIWDQHQRRLFETYCRPHLERELGVTFDLVLTVDDDIIPACCRLLGMEPTSVDFQEMSAFWGKQGSFRLWARHHATNCQQLSNLPVHLLLLDDVVYNERIVWSDLRAIVEQRNIDQL